MRFKFYILCFLFLANNSFAQSELATNLSFSEINIPENHSFANDDNNIHQIIVSSNGTVWIGCKYGLYKYNGNELIDVITIAKNDFSDIIQNMRIRSLTFDDQGQLWLGTYKGIFIFNKKEYSLKKLLVDPSNEDSKKNECWGIKYHDGKVYYLTSNGLWLINSKLEAIVDSFLVENRPDALQHTINFDFLPDYLIGAYVKGIFKINIKTKEIEIFPYDYLVENNEATHHFFYDGVVRDSIYWVPSYGIGMVSFDLKTNTYNHYKRPEYPISGRGNLIKNLVPYNDSLMIINVTNKGVGTFNINSKKYNFHNDIAKTNPYLQWVDQAFSVDLNGKLYVGDFKRIYKSNEQLFPSTINQTYALDFYEYKSNNGSINKFDDRNIWLNKSEDYIKFKYCLINPLEPQKIRYQYKLNGVSNDWINSGNATNFVQRNLTKSSYELIVQAFKGEELLAEKKLMIHKELFFYQKLWFKLLSVASICFILFALIMNRTNRIKDRTNLERTYNKKLSEIEMSALRAQMNPHFLFNSLNSIKYYALNKGPEETADYISKFSLLVRTILNNSKSKTISLAQEIETLKLYVEIEQLRFEKEFNFKLHIDKKLDLEHIEFPPMLIQPFLENAIWHGLMHKEGNGNLTLSIVKESAGLMIIIDDDGIGRTQSTALQKSKLRTKNKSFGMQITADRLELIEQNTGVKSHLEIVDKIGPDGEAMGTTVIVKVPNVL